MLLKHGASNSIHFPSLQSLFNYVREQSCTIEISEVAYVQISSERADLKSTLINILTKMHETFVVEQNQKWLIVVGDAKTYDIRSVDYPCRIWGANEVGHSMAWKLAYFIELTESFDESLC